MSDRKIRHEVVFRNRLDIGFQSIVATSIPSTGDRKRHAKF